MFRQTIPKTILKIREEEGPDPMPLIYLFNVSRLSIRIIFLCQ